MRNILSYCILLLISQRSVESIPVFTDFSINNPTQVHYGPIHKLQNWPPSNPEIKSDKSELYSGLKYQFALTPSYFNPSLTNNPKNAVEIFKKLATISTSCILISLPVTTDGDSPIYSLKFRDVLYNPSKEESDKDAIILLDDVANEVQSTMGPDALNTIVWKWVDCNLYTPGPIANTGGTGLNIFSKYAAQQQGTGDSEDAGQKGNPGPYSPQGTPGSQNPSSNNNLQPSMEFGNNGSQPLVESNGKLQSIMRPNINHKSTMGSVNSNSLPLMQSKTNNFPSGYDSSNSQPTARVKTTIPESFSGPNTDAPQLQGSYNKDFRPYTKPSSSKSRLMDGNLQSQNSLTPNRSRGYSYPSSSSTQSSAPQQNLSIPNIFSTDSNSKPNSNAGKNMSPLSSNSFSNVNNTNPSYSLDVNSSIPANESSKNTKSHHNTSSPKGSTLTLSIPPDFKSVLKTFNGPLKLKLK